VRLLFAIGKRRGCDTRNSTVLKGGKDMSSFWMISEADLEKGVMWIRINTEYKLPGLLYSLEKKSSYRRNYD
jgi:hypothetical protein